MNTEKPLKRMTCCCCGSRCLGRQWHNRDTGYSLCFNCIDYVSKKESTEEIHENYGELNYHYGIKEE
jgi:hypothetical protein